MKSNISIRNLIAKGQFPFYSALIEKFTFFIFFVFLARKTSVEDYGSIVAIFAFTNILANFFEFGFGPYFQREAATNNEKFNEELQTAISFKLISFPFFITIIFFYFTFSHVIDVPTLLIIGITIFIFFVNSIFSSILFGKNLYFKSFQSIFLSRIFIIFLISLSFFLLSDIRIAFLILFTGSLLQSYLLLKVVRSLNIKVVLRKVDKKILKKIITSSFPIGIGISFVFVYDKIDVLLIEKIINPETVAIYAVAYSIYKLPQILASVLLVPLYSDFSTFFRDNNKLPLNLLIKPAAVFIFIGIIIIVGINFTSEFLLTNIYGIKYINSSWILNMLCIALPGLFLDELMGTTLYSIRKEKAAMYSRFIAVVINIGINLILLKRIGIEGAIIATIAAEYSSFIIQLFVLKSSKNSA